jgi:hypothetical protein
MFPKAHFNVWYPLQRYQVSTHTPRRSISALHLGAPSRRSISALHLAAPSRRSNREAKSLRCVLRYPPKKAPRHATMAQTGSIAYKYSAVGIFPLPSANPSSNSCLRKETYRVRVMARLKIGTPQPNRPFVRVSALRKTTRQTRDQVLHMDRKLCWIDVYPLRI